MEDYHAFKSTSGGSGGGGGGSANGDPNSLAGMGVSRLRANNGNTVLYQKSCPISFAVKLPELNIKLFFTFSIFSIKSLLSF